MFGVTNGPLYEGLAYYRDGDRFGFRDAEGRIAIPARFEEAANFHEGRALAKVGGLYGYIDAAGREVVPPSYVHASHFSAGRALVMLPDRRAFVIDREGAHLFRVEPGFDDSTYFVSDGCVRIRRGSGVGFLDLEGRTCVPCVYEDADAHFSDGLVRVKRGGLWGYANRAGTEVIACAYTHSESFAIDGTARVGTPSGYGLVDRSGRLIVPCRYIDVGRAHEGRVAVSLPPTRDADECYNRRGYVDLEGHEVIPCVFENAGDFVEGRAEVAQKFVDGTTRTFCIDRDGREVAPS